MLFRRHVKVLIVMLSLLVATSASAQIRFTYTRIADTNTAIPGGSGDFTNFDSEGHVISGTEVVFDGGGSGQEGRYLWSGGTLSRIVDLTTAIPGGTGNFILFTDFGFSGSTVIVSGHGSGPHQEGIYSFTSAGGSPTVIADFNTAIPSGSGNFADFAENSYDGGAVFFGGESAAALEGVYTNTSGALARVADENTLLPDGSGDTFDRFFEPAIRNGLISFRATVGSVQDGIYADFGSGLTVVADETTTLPGGGGTFTGFDESSIDGNNVAFQARDASSASGVYLSEAGSISVIADANTPMPNGPGTFMFASDPTVDGDFVLFDGSNEIDLDGVYLSYRRVIVPVATTGDLLDGRIVDVADTNPHNALRGNLITFTARFTDGSRGVYLAEIDPRTLTGIPSLGGLGIGLLVVLLAGAAVLALKR